MTAAELEELVRAGDVVAVHEACLGGDVPTEGRAALVEACGRIVSKGWWSTDGFSEEQVDAAATVLTGTATIAELGRIRHRHLPQDLSAALALLQARDQPFRDAWVALAVDVERLDPRGLRVARYLIAAGEAATPPDDGYAVALASHPASFDRRGSLDTYPRGGTVLDILRANPDLLLEDVWRLFTVEGGGEHSLAAHDKYCPADAGWRVALVALADEGTLDRDRLLDASLDALGRGFAPFRAQWFSAFHEALEPTPDERTARVSTYLALTASPVGPTVTMALKALLVVDRAGGLDPTEVVAHLGPAVLAPAKGNAARALRLLGSAVEADPSYAEEAAAVAVEALAHPSADVQAAALALVRSWVPEPDPDLLERARTLGEGCAPAVRAELAGWLGADLAPGRGSLPAVEVRDLPLGALDWLRTDRALAPPSDLDALLELASSVLESPDDPDAVELVLAGAAETGRAPIAGDARAGTLGRRAVRLVATDHVAQRLVARVLAAWAAPDVVPTEPAWRSGDRVELDGRRPRLGLGELLRARVMRVVDLVAAGSPHELLATPTHVGGVLDPVVLAERLDRASTVDPVELTFALLRVAPQPDRLAMALDALVDEGGAGALVRNRLVAWAGHCADLAARPAAWSSSSRQSGDVTFFDLHVDGVDELTPAGVPLGVTEPTTQWGIFSQDPAGVRWLGTLVPAMPAVWARLGARAVGPTAGDREVAHGDVAYLERFAEQDTPVGEDALLLLALALDDQRPEVRTMAVDVTLAAVEDRRLDPVGLGRQIGRLLGTGLVTPARWGGSLREVAADGDLGASAVVRAVQEAVAIAEPRRPQDLLALLELLEEILVDRGLALEHPGARDALARVTGQGKTAAAGRRLLSVGPT